MMFKKTKKFTTLYTQNKNYFIEEIRDHSMEEIQETAQVYYKAVSKKVRKLAKEFFNKMDDNGDGKVSLAEFTGFMGEEGYEAMNNPDFFEGINKNINGEFDFDDVKTLYYILQSGRPLCGCCRKLIVGMYFTCVKCFSCDTQSFCLHPACFGRGKYVHKHFDFLDNYALLESVRHKGLPSGDAQKNQTTTLLKPCKSEPSTSRSLAIVPISKTRDERWSKTRAALKALEIAMSAVGMGTKIASTVCTIM
ncbi:unnamed protein product [Camellia sinensis]